MSALKQTFAGLLAEIRGKRNLQYGLLAMALLGCSELFLQWSDWQTAQEKTWQTLHGELRALRTQSRDEALLRSQLDELEKQQELVDQRLWRVSSEAVGQARLKDWLGEQLKKAGVGKYKLSLSAPTALDLQGGSGQPQGRSSGEANKDRQNAPELYELRANLNFAFTPAALEDFLLAIEGSEAFTAVESLKVARRERSVDLGLRLLVRIQPEPPPAAEPEKADSPPATADKAEEKS